MQFIKVETWNRPAQKGTGKVIYYNADLIRRLNVGQVGEVNTTMIQFTDGVEIEVAGSPEDIVAQVP